WLLSPSTAYTVAVLISSKTGMPRMANRNIVVGRAVAKAVSIQLHASHPKPGGRRSCVPPKNAVVYAALRAPSRSRATRLAPGSKKSSDSAALDEDPTAGNAVVSESAGHGTR